MIKNTNHLVWKDEFHSLKKVTTVVFVWINEALNLGSPRYLGWTVVEEFVTFLTLSRICSGWRDFNLAQKVTATF